MTGKYTVNIATSGGPGHYQQVLDYLNEIMLNFGSFITGSTGVSARQGMKALADTGAKAFRLGEILVSDISKKKTYSKQNARFKQNRKYFKDLVKLNKNEWTNEYKYWDKLNWK